MADREKVIKGLEEISDHFFSVYRHSKDREEINNAKDRCNAVEDALALLKEQPEIIRCENCKHHRKGICSAAAGIAVPPPDDWFCADGEKREQ